MKYEVEIDHTTAMLPDLFVMNELIVYNIYHCQEFFQVDCLCPPKHFLRDLSSYKLLNDNAIKQDKFTQIYYDKVRSSG